MCEGVHKEVPSLPTIQRGECGYTRFVTTITIPKSIFSDVSKDFIEGLPKSSSKNVIMVVVDRFTKYGHFIALSHPFTISTVVSAYMDYVFKLHGNPTSIVSDMRPIFLSEFW